MRLRYARFDLTRVSMVDPHTGFELCRLHPLDREKNADGHRAQVLPEVAEPPKKSGIAPHLARLMATFERPSKPLGFLPHERDDNPPAQDDDDGRHAQ